ICDANDLPLEKVYFEGAACTQMEIGYVQKGNGYITTMLQIQARKITVGTVSLEKSWANLIN
ncbi:MAG TPA: type VI secretion system needle protein Hcp, partial [Candidatus Atribacteria bacterium]|nr:type VI secretion system needle protein Hcp [Candidatus Atribacteria bacterium]